MKNNFTSEDLVLYLDGELGGEDLHGLQDKLHTDPDFQAEYKRLELARESIKLQGLNERVGNIHQEMMLEFRVGERNESAVVIPMFRRVMRIAAVLLLVVGGTAIYQYTQLSAGKLFDNNFVGYTTTEQRGEAAGSELEAAYKAGDMAKVIGLFQSRQQPIAQDYFYAGNAYLLQGKSTDAIQQFLKLLALNTKHQSPVFEDDTEYYLAMAYLKNGQPDKAEPLLEKIHNTKGHLYQDKVSKWLIWKVKLAANK